jgi:hypothetical protein
VKLKKVAAENTELLPEVYGEDGKVINPYPANVENIVSS